MIKPFFTLVLEDWDKELIIILNTLFHIAEGLLPVYYKETDEITKECFDNKLLGVIRNFNLDK